MPRFVLSGAHTAFGAGPRATPDTACEIAPAKINLFLHLLGRRMDGYHDLVSRVGFTKNGDRLWATDTAQPGFTLALTGPFAAALAQAGGGDTADNLVLQAAQLLAQSFPHIRPCAFTLEKNLPVASGIGGGSSDAAAALRLLALRHDLALDDPAVQACARALGADVPVCLMPAARDMRGIGHDLAPPLPARWMPVLLVNPGRALGTKDVFGQIGLKQGEIYSPKSTLRLRNDLEAAAMALVPEIEGILTALRAAPGCLHAGMSGSGATCFGLFDTPEACATAHAALASTAQFAAYWLWPDTITLPTDKTNDL